VTVVIAFGLLAASCAEPDPSVGGARESAVVELTIRSLVLADTEMDPDPAEIIEIPVVYVTRDTGEFTVDVQASVAAALLDEATVRFADNSLEAVDEGLETLPVLSEGQLLIFGEIPERGRNMVITVTRYLDADDIEDLSLMLGWRSPEWVVQSITTL